MTSKPLTHLGSKSILTPQQIESPRTILESFPSPKPQRDYEVKFIFPEFTSMCPVTGQPDFATITLTYIPDQLCVEMKSLKLYYLAYRNKGIFYEGVVNTILDDLVALLSPRHMTVVGDFAVRGALRALSPRGMMYNHDTPATPASRALPAAWSGACRPTRGIHPPASAGFGRSISTPAIRTDERLRPADGIYPTAVVSSPKA